VALAGGQFMAVIHSVNGDPFVPGKPRLWVEKQTFFRRRIPAAGK
jgi:hypothetical protein